MAQYKNTNCPSCGAPNEVNRFAAMAICAYCGAGYYFRDEAVLAMGEMAIMAEYDTPLYVGASGRLRKKRFYIDGRVRYRYERGFWDEWYFVFDDGSNAWICEDELEFSLEKDFEKPTNIPSFESLSPGSPLRLGDLSFAVNEKDTAYFEGAEGSLPFVLSKDRQFPFVDASNEESTATIEYSEEGPEIFIGEWVDQEEIQLDHPKPETDDTEWSDA